jgi:hypothetical protein
MRGSTTDMGQHGDKSVNYMKMLVYWRAFESVVPER